jgi:DNA-binding NarL/FixJ family response regulator
MSENGFSAMGRSFGRMMQHVLRYLMNSDFEDELPNQTSRKELVMTFDSEISELLSERAREEDMDTGPYVIELVNNALHGSDTQTMIERWQLLTNREQEVAALACKGMTNPQIAESLYITEETVKKHISSILRKFEIRGRGILKWVLEGWNFDNPQAPWEI